METIQRCKAHEEFKIDCLEENIMILLSSFFFFEISDTENIYTALVKSLEVILKLESRILKRKLEFRNLKKWFLDTSAFTESTKVEYTRYSKGYKYISVYYDV